MIMKMINHDLDRWAPIGYDELFDIPDVKADRKLLDDLQELVEVIRRGERHLRELSALKPEFAAKYAMEHAEGVLDVEVEMVDLVTSLQDVDPNDYMVEGGDKK
jgi:hypothetical protein